MKELIGTIAGTFYPLFFLACYIPQLRRTFKYKDVEGLSYKMFLLSLFGYISCSLYMLKIGFNLGMTVNAISGSVCCLVLMGAISKFRKGT